MSNRLDVLLPVLPFAPVTHPVLGISILKAAAAQAGFSAAVRYFAFDFAERVGFRSYGDVAFKWSSLPLVGDWIFAEYLYGNRLPPADRFLEHLVSSCLTPRERFPNAGLRKLGMTMSQYFVEGVWPGILKARKLVPEFVESCAQEILALEPRVAGFRCSAHQTGACLAVARRLKTAPQPPIIVVGGPDCHRELGWHWLHSFPWIDYACTGEGEEVFPRFLRKALRGDPIPSIPGILSRQDDGPSVPPPLADLDDSPVPDHSDYYNDLARCGSASEVGATRLPLEMSRGCWWGEKCQCAFCGLPSNHMAYRTKSAGRVLTEIERRAREHPIDFFFNSDSALDKKHIGAVFAKLGKSQSRPRFHCQVRADLTREQLQMLSKGGLISLWAGIESFSDALLRLMRKGTTGLGNIQLLRWCEEMGIETKGSWRILYGFPGEPVAEYEYMARLVPLLTHLPPPDLVTQINLLRFSPHGLAPSQFGFVDVQPDSYSFVYPFGREELAGIAYQFSYRYADGRSPDEYTRQLCREVGVWMELWQTSDGSYPRLDLRAAGEEIVITDTRPCAAQRTHRLRGLPARIYRKCDSVQSFAKLLQVFHAQADDTALRGILDQLVGSKLMLEDRGKYLSLAVNERTVRGNGQGG
jgi:ribosomal peptide maturation radical SAM protein 1